MGVTALSAFFLPSLTATPFFATRPLLTTLVLALLARFTGWIPGAPDWFTANATLIALGVLALLEVLSVKNEDVRALLNEFDPLFKAGVNAVVAYLLVGTTTGNETGGLIPASLSLAGPALGLLWSAFTGVSVWLLATWRRNVWEFLTDTDEGDDIGLQGVLSWIEDVWVIGGTLVAVIFPLLALFTFFATLLGLYLTQRWLAHVEEQRKVPCPYCDALLHASAVRCFQCGQAQPQPMQVGLLGQARKLPVIQTGAQNGASLAEHQHRLRTRKRCPNCATRLPTRTIQQPCPACGVDTFANRAEFDAYMSGMRENMPRVLLLCFVMGLIPVLGIVPGVIYYHLALIASLRSYVPRHMGCVARAVVTIINVLLVMVQWVPFVGALTVPVMALTNYGVYAALIRREARELPPVEAGTDILPMRTT